LAEDRVRVICGPTGAGKSAIAAGLALEHGATIVSADSRQIYRGFDIGTAKPEWSEMKAIPHEGIDVADPTERYSASQWAAMASEAIARATALRREAIVVGGTGFYIRALVDPLFEPPPLEAERRAQLENYLARIPTAELRRWCRELDPRRAHLGRVQLLRAVEIALLAGRRMSDMHAQHRPDSSHRPVYLVVDPGTALLSRIEGRLDAMLDRGWLDEVIALDAAVPDDAPAWKASGYRAMRDVSRGELDLATARERIIIETRQYAKRQRTWFRNQLGAGSVTRVDPADPACPAVVQRWWKESS